MDLGTSIKELRKNKGYKQVEFADMIEISPTALSQIEGNNATPKKSTLEKICNQLGVTLELLYLMSVREEDIPERNKDKYATMFPQVREMMLQIFSEESNAT